MTATNHALTGAVIGLSVSQPLLAVVLALLSHFVLDAVPHFGATMPQDSLLKTNTFRNYLLAEVGLCFMIVLVLFSLQPVNWLLAAICAFVAASPDLASADRYFSIRAGKPWRLNLYHRFASRIQWFERPIGALVEIAWVVGALVILVKLLKN